MSDISKEQEAVTLKLIENVLMGNKEAAQNELQKLVNLRMATQIQKVGKETLI
jgi:predicted HTH transcriptional regulator